MADREYEVEGAPATATATARRAKELNSEAVYRSFLQRYGDTHK